MVKRDHQYFIFRDYDKNCLEVVLKDIDDEKLRAELRYLMEKTLNTLKIGANKVYILKKKEQTDFIDAAEKVSKNIGKESESESDDDEDSDSDDDELVERALARQFKSVSSQDTINEQNISDSETEDPISLCRRLRTIYSKLAEHEKRLAKLEKL